MASGTGMEKYGDTMGSTEKAPFFLLRRSRRKEASELIRTGTHKAVFFMQAHYSKWDFYKTVQADWLQTGFELQ